MHTNDGVDKRRLNLDARILSFQSRIWYRKQCDDFTGSSERQSGLGGRVLFGDTVECLVETGVGCLDGSRGVGIVIVEDGGRTK